MRTTEKFKNIILCLLLGLVIVAILFCRLTNQIVSDDTLNLLLKECIQKTAIAMFMAVAFFVVKKNKVKKYKVFWLLPLCLVPIVNFPIVALIKGEAYIIRTDLIWLLCINCLLTALFEELFFRGIVIDFLWDKIKTKYKVLKTILISAGLFGLWHLSNISMGLAPCLLQVLYTFLLGCMFGLTYIITGKVLPSVILHCVFNIGGQLVPVLGGGNGQDLSFWILTIVSGIIVGIYCLVLYLKLAKKSNDLQ